jgi:hypothetical protein
MGRSAHDDDQAERAPLRLLHGLPSSANPDGRAPKVGPTQAVTVRPLEVDNANLLIHGPEVLQEVENRLNGRPRKVLGWATPAEVFARSVSS